MMKKIFGAVVTIALLIVLSALYLYAQRPAETAPDFNNPEFAALAKKLDAIAQDLGRMDSATAKKLDQVLSNQEKILSELAIVKIRATMAR